VRRAARQQHRLKAFAHLIRQHESLYLLRQPIAAVLVHDLRLHGLEEVLQAGTDQELRLRQIAASRNPRCCRPRPAR
jgi:hypothetical protein